MDLKRYKQKVENQLRDDIRKQMESEQHRATGVTKAKPNKKKMAIKKSEIEEPDEIEGGKMHFLKHMKHFGRDINHAMHSKPMRAVGKFATDTGKEIGKAATSKVAKEVGSKLGEIGIGALKTAVIASNPELAPIVMAAGMKKPKKKRVLSEKEKRRHALIRELMQEHGCSLAEASKHIKENNIDY